MPILLLFYHDFIQPIFGISLFAAIIGAFWKYFTNKRIVEVQGGLQKEIADLSSRLDKQKESFVHVFKAKFDLEIKVYQEIWAAIFELRSATLSMQPRIDFVPQLESDEEKRDRLILRHKRFVENYNIVLVLYVKYQPFYPENIHAKINLFMGACNKEGTRFQNMISSGFDNMRTQHDTYIEELETNYELIGKMIRARLEKVSIIEDEQ